jgi:hypothetical protein
MFLWLINRFVPSEHIIQRHMWCDGGYSQLKIFFTRKMFWPVSCLFPWFRPKRIRRRRRTSKVAGALVRIRVGYDLLRLTCYSIMWHYNKPTTLDLSFLRRRLWTVLSNWLTN